MWRAITEPEHLAKWFPSDIEGERAVGAKLRFPVLRFELVPDGDGTTLTFVNTFDELGKAARDAAGWHVCLDALVHLVAGDGQAPPDWKLLNEEYNQRLGPEASTMGPPDWAT